jgi:predicted NodU family carbamoyl transferase
MGHGVVRNEEIDVRGGTKDLCCAGGIARGADLVAFVFEEGAGEGTDVWIIVYNEDGGGDVGAGRVCKLHYLQILRLDLEALFNPDEFDAMFDRGFACTLI